GFGHHRKYLSHFARTTTGKKSDQILIAVTVDLPRLKPFDHWMPHQKRAEPRCSVQIGLKWKNAQHEIDEMRHLLDASTVPCPDLWADVIDCLLALRSPSQRARES